MRSHVSAPHWRARQPLTSTTQLGFDEWESLYHAPAPRVGLLTFCQAALGSAEHAPWRWSGAEAGGLRSLRDGPNKVRSRNRAIATASSRSTTPRRARACEWPLDRSRWSRGREAAARRMPPCPQEYAVSSRRIACLKSHDDEALAALCRVSGATPAKAPRIRASIAVARGL